MGNTSTTPDKIAANTGHAYQGSIDDLFKKKLAFQLFNPVYGETLFVSTVDKIEPDFLVESHPNHSEERNHFYLHKVDGTDWPGYTLYHSNSGQYVFVSNDRSGQDHIVEAHPYFKEQRNCFQFQQAAADKFLYRIYNATYNEYMFVSNELKGGKHRNHVIKSHRHQNEERNLFEIQLIETDHGDTSSKEDDDGDEKMQSEDASVPTETKDAATKENEDEDDGKLCIVCMENNKDHVIVPCGHLCLCGECLQEHYADFTQATCPLCQCQIQNILKTYQ